jgi:hypothetical protein
VFPSLIFVASVLRLDETTTPDADSVTPGTVGFIVTFLVAVAVVLLIIDMVRRIRRVNYREAVKEKIREEEAAARAATSDSDDQDRA